MNFFIKKRLLKGKQWKDSSFRLYVIAKGIDKWLGTVKYVLLYVFVCLMPNPDFA